MSASEQLTGLGLQNGWQVMRPLARPEGSTGGQFSNGYLVQRGESVGYLKAIDFSRAFGSDVDTVDELQKLTSAYSHERDILIHCKERRLSNVVVAIEYGSVQVPNLNEMEGRVHYLIFEMAECDVRFQVDVRKQRNFVWAARVAKDACLGLWQVHREMIAHQDIKPSNVLVYATGTSKISDFGRSSRRGRPALHDEFTIPGDRTYASPELLYGYTSPEFNARRFGSDLYMLGNLLSFLFSGANITSALFQRLAPEHHFHNWNGSYHEALPYLVRAHALALNDIGSEMHPIIRQEVLPIVSELSCPDLSKRGSRCSIGKHDQFSLERYVSKLDRLAKEAEVRARISSSAT